MARSHVINMSIFASFSLSEEEAECVFIQGYISINGIKLRCFVLDPQRLLRPCFVKMQTTSDLYGKPHTDSVYGVSHTLDC